MSPKIRTTRAQLVSEHAVVPSERRSDRAIARLLAVGAVGEGTTGLVLIGYPSAFISFLIGAELSEAGIALGRMTGFALLALGAACWSGARSASGEAASVRALLIYGLFATVYLFVLGLGGALVGILLWPAVAAHALLTFLLARAWFRRPP